MNYMYKSMTRLVGAFLMIAFVFSATTQASAITISLTGDKVTPPEVIGNLSMPFYTTNEVTLRWDVPSADTDEDYTYDIRYSTDMITASNFESATPAKGSPIDASKLRREGNERMFVVSGLTPGKKYHFALKSKSYMSGWSSISAMPSMTLPNLAPTTSTFPNTNLGYGQTNPSVSDLQTFLTKQGVYSGPITTYFGSMTKKAVIAFQQKNKITPAEGYVGPLTRKVIQTLLVTK